MKSTPAWPPEVANGTRTLTWRRAWRWNPQRTRRWLPVARVALVGAGLLGLVLPQARAQAGLTLQGAAGPVAAIVLDSHIEVDVSGVLARSSVQQSFRNVSEEWVAGEYSFPLPPGAAVDTLELRVGGRRIVGEIRERTQARAQFEQARASGVKAALVEQDRPNLFRTGVANIPPGETVQIRIGFQHLLPYTPLGHELVLPLAITPRFDPDGGGEQAAGQPSGAAGLTVRIHGMDRLAEVHSSSHGIRQQDAGDHILVEAAAPTGQLAPKDFILRWRPSVPEPQPVLFIEEIAGQRYGLLVVYPPGEVPGTGRVDQQARELVMVIDTSGSMEGASIRQAREAVGLAIGRLGPQDRFNVIQFNDAAESLFPRSMPGGAWYRGQAENYVRHLVATGGTNMLPALEAALAGPVDEERLRQVVFVTDGAVANEDALFGLIARRLGDSRLFTVGIGPAPNRHFMEGAARLGRGATVQVPDLQTLQARMQQLFDKLEHPALTDIRISLPDGSDLLAEQAPVPDLYLGDPVVASFRLPGDPGLLTVTGRAGTEHWVRQLHLPGTRHPGVARLWGRQRIRELEAAASRGEDAGQVRAGILEVALGLGLVSRHTSLVAVEQTPARPPWAGLGQARLSAPAPEQALSQVQFPPTGLGLAMHGWLALGALGAAALLAGGRP